MPSSFGPDLFFLRFELSGVCYNCPSETTFFDQILPPGMMTRRLQRRMKYGNEEGEEEGGGQDEEEEYMMMYGRDDNDMTI